MFQSAGFKPGNKMVVYCHIGQYATLLYFAAKYLGYDVKRFDGAYEEWSKNKDLPIGIQNVRNGENNE